MNIQLVNEAREAAEALEQSVLGRMKLYFAKNFGKKIFLCYEGPEKHEHWTGENPFYLFWCHVCEHWAKNYPNGFPEKQRLHCSNCDTRYSFIQLHTRFQMLREFFKLIRSIRKMKREQGSGGGGTGLV
ncbi:MAG: hypothetical protein HYT93_03365 [Parcubacteria group bacterium]|nr:hypothetical protein [Parcubacteria group bacterium]